jgi:hypothetical protein
MQHYLRAAVSILGVAAVMPACWQQREPATAENRMWPEAGATSETASNDTASDEMRPASGARSAAEQIAEARCHREKTCGNVGPGQSYASLADCRDFVQANWKADLDSLVCPAGINLEQLDECLTEINGASCNSPFDKLERAAACTQGQICVEDG